MIQKSKYSTKEANILINLKNIRFKTLQDRQKLPNRYDLLSGEKSHKLKSDSSDKKRRTKYKRLHSEVLDEKFCKNIRMNKRSTCNINWDRWNFHQKKSSSEKYDKKMMRLKQIQVQKQLECIENKNIELYNKKILELKNMNNLVIDAKRKQALIDQLAFQNEDKLLKHFQLMQNKILRITQHRDRN